MENVSWIQIITVIGANLILIMSMFSIVITLHAHQDKKYERYREKQDASLNGHQKEIASLINAIREDIRDFHGRLCAIEEKNKK